MLATMRRIAPTLLFSLTAYADPPPGDFECRLDFPNTAGPRPSEEPRPLLGETRILIIFHNYNPALQTDDPDPLPQFVPAYTLGGQTFTVYDREDIYGLVFDGRYPSAFAHETVNDWYREVSNDRFRITGDVVAYCTLDIDMFPRPSQFADSDNDLIDDYREWQVAVERGAIQCAQERGHNVDLLHVPDSEDSPYGLDVVGDYDRIVFVDPWGGGAYAIAFDVVHLNGAFRASWLIHELGHLFRYGHANGWDCGAYTVHPPPGAPACLSVHGNPPPTTEYWDPCSIMGAGDGHFGARHKLGLAWFDPAQELTALLSGQYRLTPLETAWGSKLIRVPRPVEGGYYYLDFRQPIGFDELADTIARRNGRDWYDAFRGVNIYNDTAPNESNMLDMTPGTQELHYDFGDASFRPNRPFIDGLNDVCVYVAPPRGSGASAEATVFVGCDIDCNSNGVYDAFDLLDGVSTDCNQNGIPDECQGGLVPPRSLISASPPSGTRDARSPHLPHDNSLEVRHGIGSGNSYAPEPIVITLDVSGVSDQRCWTLCETGIETVESGSQLMPNRIASVTERSNEPGVYELLLDRPISAKHWTTIRFLGGGNPVSYASLPGNVNGDLYSAPSDILDLIDCCLNRVCTPKHDFYSCDLDNDGYWTAYDRQRLNDLLNGVQTFIPWYYKKLPPNTCIGETGGGGGGICTSDPCDGDPGPMAMASFGGDGLDSPESTGSSTGDDGTSMTPEEIAADNAITADWVVDYLTTANPADSAELESFNTVVDGVTALCLTFFTADERSALADRLGDPTLDFASNAGAVAADEFVNSLTP